MRRQEPNKYIFASEFDKTQKTHHFRNAVLILIPLLIAAVWVLNLTISRRMTMDEIRLTVLNLPEDLEGYSILHISDLHGERYGENQKAIAAALGNSRYSCVVMTGDMLGEDGDVEPLLELIALMPKETPKYLIPGDTDGELTDSLAHVSLSVFREWVLRLQEAGVTILDFPVSETRGKGRIWFVPEDLYNLDLDAVRDVYQQQLDALNRRATSLTPDDAARIRVLEYERDRVDRLKETVKEFKPEDIQIVVTHAPLTEEYLTDMISWRNKEDIFSLRYASLILAGHYNGGQWRIPFKGAIHVPELGWFPDDELVQGLSYPAGIPQYISPGLGSDPHYTNQPGRLFNGPKITRIVLTRRGQ